MTSVTIIGAGIFGLSCAWEMARRGASVRVIEAIRIGAGASGGQIGALSPHSPENWNPKKAFQLDSLLAAQDFWAEVARTSGRDAGYARTGRLQPVADAQAGDRLHDRIAQAAERWPAAMGMALTARPDSALIPRSDIGLWLADGLSARLAPRAALAALAGAITARGGVIDVGQAARPGDLDGPVLWATGARGLMDLGHDLGRPVGIGVKGQSATLALPLPPTTPQILADGLHIVPHADGTVAVGSTTETDFADGAPDARIDALIARARAICPALADAPVIERWAGLRPRARSRAPLLGPWPGRPGHVVANGGFKIGFGMAPAVAAVIADLMLEGRDRIPDGFRLG